MLLKYCLPSCSCTILFLDFLNRCNGLLKVKMS
nr:MAG TPA: hypothetical protein [Caudoviricetes sp.]